jgi:hypothetical protein
MGRQPIEKRRSLGIGQETRRYAFDHFERRLRPVGFIAQQSIYFVRSGDGKKEASRTLVSCGCGSMATVDACFLY